MPAKCACPPGLMDDDIKRFAQQIMLELPKWSRDRAAREEALLSPFICIDPCIVNEIKAVWDAGIETTGNCCGHGVMKPWVSVLPDQCEKMIALGYKKKPVQIVNGSEMGLYTFYL